MSSDPSNIDYEQAAVDLEAAASHIYPFLERLDDLIVLMDSSDNTHPENVPSDLQFSVDDLFSAHSSGEKTFWRNIAAYPDLAEEWLPGTRQQMALTFLKGLRAIFAEKFSVLRHCAFIARGKAGLLRSKPDDSIQYYYGDVHMGDNYLAGQAGAMGPDAHTHNMSFEQAWSQSADSIDLAILASELSALSDAMRSDASCPEHEIAIGNISAAERAAADGDMPVALKYLKNSGKWALEVGQKVGVDVAVAAIKKSLGL